MLAVAAVAVAGLASAMAAPISIGVSGYTNPPIGYIDFCKNFPAECRPSGAADPEAMTQAHWRDLEEVNTFVNRIIVPATDEEYYHTEELWTIPETSGDCEDYVLLKRKWLVERGWPTGALLVTVVFDEVGDGHAVLMARTTAGDFVLDNKTDDIRIWYATAYRYVKRQSVSDPNRWVSVGDTRYAAPSTAAPR
jgi:predicted transglutaminase-like cysteine proteinase